MHLVLRRASALCLASALSLALANAAPAPAPSNAADGMWDLSDLYPNAGAWSSEQAAVTKDIALLLDHVTQVNADAHVNLFGLLFLGIVGLELGLNVLRTLHGVDDGGKLKQEAVTGSLNDVAVMCSYSLLDDLVMDGQYPQRAGFVATHLAAEADEVGEHDRGQPAGLGRRLCRVLLHDGDYVACFS